MVTSATSWNCAASSEVAICVLVADLDEEERDQRRQEDAARLSAVWALASLSGTRPSPPWR